MRKLTCTTRARYGALRAATPDVATGAHRAARSAELASASLHSNEAPRRSARQRWRGEDTYRKVTCIYRLTPNCKLPCVGR
jgi:hypothetical protein